MRRTTSQKWVVVFDNFTLQCITNHLVNDAERETKEKILLTSLLNLRSFSEQLDELKNCTEIEIFFKVSMRRSILEKTTIQLYSKSLNISETLSILMCIK